METNYKNDIEINLIDLLWSILYRWKLMILAAVLGVILGAGYKVYSNHMSNQRLAVEAASDNETDQDEKIDSLKADLSDLEIANVDFAVIYQEKLEERERYKTDSIYMNLNPDAVNYVSIAYMIDNGYTFNYMETVQPNNAAALKYAYMNYIDNGMLVSDISGDFSDVETSGLQELISAGEGSDTDAIEMVSLKVYGKDAKQAELIADKVEQAITAYSDQVKNKIGKHELTLINHAAGIVSDQDVASAQNSLDAELIDYQTKIANYKEAFSDDQEQLYTLLAEKAGIDNEQSIDDVSDGVSADSEVAGSVDKLAGVPKFGVLGAIAGVFLVCMIIACIYLFNGCMKTGEEFTNLFGLYLLGDYNEITDGRSRLETIRRKQKWTLDEKRELTVANIKVLCQKYDITRIYLASTLHMDDKAKKEMTYIVNTLQANGIEATCGENVLHDASAMEKMSAYEYAVLVEQTNISRYDDVAQLISARNEQKNRLLGVVVL